MEAQTTETLTRGSSRRAVSGFAPGAETGPYRKIDGPTTPVLMGHGAESKAWQMRSANPAPSRLCQQPSIRDGYSYHQRFRLQHDGRCRMSVEAATATLILPLHPPVGVCSPDQDAAEMRDVYWYSLWRRCNETDADGRYQGMPDDLAEPAAPNRLQRPC
ncbi:hypothetical protein K402DRAFT_166496 [Aulographum hederae CBS 113979]|uniref:Uncharacterized protein n=1 Tax=Aulographum hederae CBS 113979 TaxID=1176131 RepID=A0A6G1GR75_9PEZI|nr:hypothetical protein K402DRAFT_166496 [Aulographum hederae CBS 113979]